MVILFHQLSLQRLLSTGGACATTVAATTTLFLFIALLTLHQRVQVGRPADLTSERSPDISPRNGFSSIPGLFISFPDFLLLRVGLCCDLLELAEREHPLVVVPNQHMVLFERVDHICAVHMRHASQLLDADLQEDLVIASEDIMAVIE